MLDRFFAFDTESSAGADNANGNIGFGASIGPFEAGLTNTFSRTEILLGAVDVAPMSVTSFDTIGDVDGAAVFDPKENLKLPNAAAAG